VADSPDKQSAWLPLTARKPASVRKIPHAAASTRPIPDNSASQILDFAASRHRHACCLNDLRKEERMITLRKVLVATDFSEPSDAALLYGRELAKRFGATVHVLHVVQNIYISTFGAENIATITPDLQRQLEDDARRHLHEQLVDSDRSGPPTVPAILTSASPAMAIVDYARDQDIDMIVMGTHGRGALAHLVMGSVAERVVRSAPCPVLTVRQNEHQFVRPDTLATAARAS
jgi:universal stress protein A